MSYIAALPEWLTETDNLKENTSHCAGALAAVSSDHERECRCSVQTKTSERMRKPENVLIDESHTSTADRPPAIAATVVQQPEAARDDRRRSASGRLGLAAAILLIALAALVPTVGDFGLTWDEPAYRYSQMFSAQWWEQLGKVQSWRDVQEAVRSAHPALLLAVRPARHQFSSRLWRAN